MDHFYTIGEFARRTGLTEKAFRLYDGKGLLEPSAIDPTNGYRLYADEWSPATGIGSRSAST